LANGRCSHEPGSLPLISRSYEVGSREDLEDTLSRGL
jgi:hypothetical protein